MFDATKFIEKIVFRFQTKLCPCDWYTEKRMKQTYASKVTRTGPGGKKVAVKVEEEEVNVEELMQGEGEQESSLLTVDEVVKGVPVVPQPKGPGPVPPFTRYGSAAPQQQMEAGLPLLYPGPGQAPPLNIYSQNSPPLPLPGPLHLVYLQPSPHGINIIPFQAVGGPTFTPSSPLGFPAHPHHPVVVQSPHLPPAFSSVPHGGGGGDQHES